MSPILRDIKARIPPDPLIERTDIVLELCARSTHNSNHVNRTMVIVGDRIWQADLDCARGVAR